MSFEEEKGIAFTVDWSQGPKTSVGGRRTILQFSFLRSSCETNHILFLSFLVDLCRS